MFNVDVYLNHMLIGFVSNAYLFRLYNSNSFLVFLFGNCFEKVMLFYFNILVKKNKKNGVDSDEYHGIADFS